MHKAVRRSLRGILPFSITELTSEIKNHCIYFSTKRPKSPVIPHFSGVEILSTFAYIFTVDSQHTEPVFAGLIAVFCSIDSPSISHRNSRCETSLASSELCGHLYFPFSSLLYSSTNPSSSHSSALIRSQRLPQNKNRLPEKYIKLEILLYNCC